MTITTRLLFRSVKPNMCLCVCVYTPIANAILFAQVHIYGISLSVMRRLMDDENMCRSIVHKKLLLFCHNRREDTPSFTTPEDKPVGRDGE